MISLRLMEDTMDDYTALRSWFLEPELQKWVWCDEEGEPPVSLERVIEKYGPRVKNPTDVFPYFILRDDEPIGFIQYYFSNATTIGLDMWIGILKERSNGYGTEALKQMVQIIHEKHPQVKEVFIDPDPDNIAAVKCYLKAGFQDTGETIWDDVDDCMLLKICFDKNSILYDSHLHTTMSVDSDLEVADAIRIAKEKNIGIVITDHMDWEFPIPYPDFRVDLELFFKEYAHLRSNTVLLGIELGMTETSIEKNRSIIAEHDFDFVLGSVHVLYGKEVDEELFHELDETDVYRDYLVTCNQLVKELNIDSFAHIDYPLRSTSRELKYKDYKSEFDTFFETLVKQDICLELNTSRLSEGEEAYNNMLSFYRAYRTKGGQYVTIGSDAHEPEEVGDNFDMVKDFLEQTDLVPVHFKKRKMVIDSF